jgi:flagellar hook-associated protein 1 FlgK
MSDQQSHVTTLVQQVNDAATELARLNRTIKVAQVNNTDTGTLSDQRDLLALDLAKLTGAEVAVQPDGQFNLALNGVALVTGDTAGAMTATSGNPVALSIGGTSVPSGVSGELGGVVDVLNTTLPAYKKSLDDIATTFANQMNAQHRAGKDLGGAAGGDLFTFDPADPSGSLAVAFTDTDLLAASAGGAKDGGNADALSRATTAGSDYAVLVTSFGSTVASINRQTANQQTLTNQVDDEREQMAGVNLDEETVNMVAAQHAYEAASKMLTVMDSILDTLINRTGVTH